MYIRIAGDDPVLLDVCEPVDIGDSSELAEAFALLSEMSDLMYETGGCGIAGPQVGISRRIIAIDTEWDPDTQSGKNPVLMVNPEILSVSDETAEHIEGCLSVPGVRIAIERPAVVSFQYIGADGEKHIIHDAEGLLARCIQHEIDHLDGKTILERATPMRRIQAISYLSEAKKQIADGSSFVRYVVE